MLGKVYFYFFKYITEKEVNEERGMCDESLKNNFRKETKLLISNTIVFDFVYFVSPIGNKYTLEFLNKGIVISTKEPYINDITQREGGGGGKV